MLHPNDSKCSIAALSQAYKPSHKWLRFRFEIFNPRSDISRVKSTRLFFGWHESMDTSRQIPAICSHNVKVIAENIVLMEIAATAKSVSPFISFAIT